MDLRTVAKTTFGFNFFWLVASILQSQICTKYKEWGWTGCLLPGSLKDWQNTQRCGGWVEGSGCSERVKKYLHEIDVNQ